MAQQITKIFAVAIALTAVSGAIGQRFSHQALGAAAQPGNVSLASLSILGSESSMGSAPPLLTAVHERSAVHRRLTGPCANAPDYGGSLTTNGTWVVDDNGCNVRLEGVTWYGMQTDNFVPAGLDFLSLDQIMHEIKQLGFNSIRIPLSDYLVKYNPKIKVSKYLKRDRSLIGLHPLQVLDRIVKEATSLHLFIILDNHVSRPVTAAQVLTRKKAADPYWYGGGFSQQTWIHDWTELATRYRSDPVVTGFDLRNEPHTGGPGPWTLKAYLTQGATWGPYPNGKQPDRLWRSNTNWPAAATKCADAILSVNPHLLMFVEGVQLYPQTSKKYPERVDAYWWGSILRGVHRYPINLANPSFERQLVYSPHEWGPWKNLAPQFYDGKVSYNSLKKLFDSQWGFILHMKDPHPIWLGEFNTCNTKASCAGNTKVGSQGWWFKVLIRYLRNNPEVGWSYYAVNGTNSLDEPSNNSILRRGWINWDRSIMNALRPIQTQPR
jgi:endoglucanase